MTRKRTALLGKTGIDLIAFLFSANLITSMMFHISLNDVLIMSRKSYNIFLMSQEVQIRQDILDGLVVKQAVRDIASKETKTSKQALLYFISDDFSNLCKRNNIEKDGIVFAIKELNEYPILSKKRLAEDVCSLIDMYFGIGNK